jgi:hypothetical protein
VIPSPENQPETDRIQSAGWILQDPIGSGIGLVDLVSIIYTNDRKIVMAIVLIISALALTVQTLEIMDLNQFKDKPIKETSWFSILVSTGTILVSLYSVGPPLSPIVVALLTLGAMICVKPNYPGLVIKLEEMMVTGMLFSLSLEFFIVGHYFQEKD